MKKVIILGVFFIGCMQSFVDLKEVDRQKNGKLLISQNQVDALYQLMKDLHDLFALYGIEYWIQGGTLVGALRHQGLMFWDDDLDINIKIDDFISLFRLQHLLKELGYYIELYPNMLVKVVKDGVCWIDIFLTYHHDNKTKYLKHWWKRGEEPIYLYDHELYPLQLYQFGELKLWGPRKPDAYLGCGFRNNYMEEVVIYNHRIPNFTYSCNLKDIPLELQKAAQPSTPLENRVSKLVYSPVSSHVDFGLKIILGNVFLLR